MLYKQCQEKLVLVRTILERGVHGASFRHKELVDVRHLLFLKFVISTYNWFGWNNGVGFAGAPPEGNLVRDLFSGRTRRGGAALWMDRLPAVRYTAAPSQSPYQLLNSGTLRTLIDVKVPTRDLNITLDAMYFGVDCRLVWSTTCRFWERICARRVH